MAGQHIVIMNNNDRKDFRKEERIHFTGKILVNGKLVFKCIDICEGGLYVYTGNSFEENKLINVTLPIKDKPLTVTARVQHNQPGIGMGLQFVNLNDEQKVIIKKIIKSIIKKSAKPIDERKKVLLVEDNDISRQIYKSKLFMEGFFIAEARDGMEAIRLLNDFTPDLTIFNLNTNGMDCFKVLTILKNHPKCNDFPIIVFSERCTQDFIEKAIKAGADEFLIKMLTSPSKLAETAKAVLQRREK